MCVVLLSPYEHNATLQFKNNLVQVLQQVYHSFRFSLVIVFEAVRTAVATTEVASGGQTMQQQPSEHG